MKVWRNKAFFNFSSRHSKMISFTFVKLCSHLSCKSGGHWLTQTCQETWMLRMRMLLRARQINSPCLKRNQVSTEVPQNLFFLVGCLVGWLVVSLIQSFICSETVLIFFFIVKSDFVSLLWKFFSFLFWVLLFIIFLDQKTNLAINALLKLFVDFFDPAQNKQDCVSRVSLNHDDGWCNMRKQF